MEYAMNRQSIAISDNELEQLAQIVYQKYGIVLTTKKRALIISRLQPILIKRGFTNFQDYVNFIAHANEAALTELVNRITTNHTYFFREMAHFDFLTNTAFPEFVEYHKKINSNNLRIWCAAASTGEEPYSLAMQLKEYFGNDYSRWKAGLLATDISEAALEKALEGIYSSEAVNKLPKSLVSRYFAPHESAFKVTSELQKEVVFRKFNLMTEVFPFKKNFDLISCRNVMIYFDNPTKEVLVNKLYEQLRPGGYLFIGHSESLNGLSTPFDYVTAAIYQKRK